MAVLTTLVRLLELKATELEAHSPDGTGPLEDDIALLQRAELPEAASHAAESTNAAGVGKPASGTGRSLRDSADFIGGFGAGPDAQSGGSKAGGVAGRQGQAEGLPEGPGGALEGWRRACVVYRAGQKRLARGYLRAARGALAEEMRRMLALESDLRGR